MSLTRSRVPFFQYFLANGSMTSRNVDGTTYTMNYDPENRLISISGGSLTARYVFDGDGRRVLSVVGDTRTLYVNQFFEITMENDAKVNQDLTIENVDLCENRNCVFVPLAINDIEAIGMQNGNFGTRTFITEIMEPDNVNVTWRIYYPGGGLRVQTTTGDNLSYLVQDHLNSTAMTLSNSGAVTGEVIYSAWGETRATYGTTPTKKLYTGQYEAEAGLYFYNARWYDPYLNHMIQPDTIIPDPYNPQDWNRYSYVRNNPTNYTDPTGHRVLVDEEADGLSVRYNNGRQIVIVTGGDVFRNPVEKAIANALLTGDTTYLDSIPMDISGGNIEHSLLRSGAGLGYTSSYDFGSWTLSFGLGGAGFIAAGARGGVFIAVDSSGSIGAFYSLGGGGFTAVGANRIGPFITVTNAPSIDYLKNWSIQVGGQGGEGATLGGEVVIFSNNGEIYFGLTAAGGGGVMAPFLFEGHATFEHATMFWGPFDVFQALSNLLTR